MRVDYMNEIEKLYRKDFGALLFDRVKSLVAEYGHSDTVVFEIAKYNPKLTLKTLAEYYHL